MYRIAAKAVRRLTGSIVFRKALPRDFARERIYVTSRSDIRVLLPGFSACADDLLQVVRKYILPGDVVWDIGSNVGIFTFCSAIRVGRSGAVFSLEADPRYADLQTRTLKRFTGDAGSVSILCAAAADKLGILELAIPTRGHARNHLNVVAGNSPGATEMLKEVVAVTLDWLLERWTRPNFVKIDVEGAELIAAKGAIKLFTDIRPAGYIECSPSNAAELTEFFREKDYLLYKLDRDGRERAIDAFAFNTLVKPREMASI